MMERVFQNLIDNAIKSTPEGGKIQVSITADNADLVFRIENSGSPLPEELLNWINNHEGESSLSGNRLPKLGLGLLIIKKILLLHQYTFRAESNTGIGNAFTIVMPIVQHTPYNPAA
jgi:signal transduction histidine kinase